MKHRISKAMHILAIIFLLSVFLSGIFLGLPRAGADDPGSKITGSLRTTLLEKTSGVMPMTGFSASAAKPDSVDVFIYLDQQPDAAKLADLAAAGVTVYADTWIPSTGNHPRGFVTATLPVVNLDGLAAKSYVAKIDSAERTATAQNDVAAQVISTQSYWPSKFTGKGVKVAVLDSGLDTTHPDIPTPIFQKDVSDINYIHDNVTSPIAGGSSHGTHVAGSVLGRGTLSNGKYKGMAYEADLIFLKIGDNFTTSAPTASIVKALKDSIDVYKADIISMSYGGWDSFHDGSSAECQAADYAVSKGATVFIAAGNEADKALHYSGTVYAGQTTGFIQINVTNSTGSNCRLISNLVWYDGLLVNKDLTLQYYDSDQNPISTASMLREKSTRGTSAQLSWWGDSSTINFLPAGSSTYYIKVSNSSTATQVFHIYTNTSLENSKYVKFQTPDPFYTTGSPADADSVICVGSYTSRGSWTDYQGGTWNFSGMTVGTVSSFSNRGPRVDTGAPTKPDIVSPGSVIISCRDRSDALSSYSVSDNGINDGTQPANYTAQQGTSMACPVASGATAVLMQAYPGLKGNPAKVKAILRRSGSRYSTPDYAWGYGLFSLQRILQIWPKRTSTDSLGNQSRMAFSTDLGTISITGKANAEAANARSLYFPYGAYSYKVSLLEPSGSARITIDMPADASDEYWDFSDGNWQLIHPLSSEEDRIVIQLQDGGIGDSDHQPDGEIEDIGGPAVPSSSSTGMGAGTPTGISGGTSATPSLTAQAVALPSITVQDASISNTTVKPGEEVQLTARIANTGTAGGQAAIKIYVNGEEESQQAVSIDHGQVLRMQFTLQRSDPGTYTVQVNNISAGTFTVEDRAPRDLMITIIFIALLSGIALISILLWRRTRTED